MDAPNGASNKPSKPSAQSMLRSIQTWNLRIQEARGGQDEHAHVFRAGNGWPDRATHLLHLAAGGRANSGQPRWRACVLAILSCYYMCALAKGSENLPGCGLERRVCTCSRCCGRWRRGYSGELAWHTGGSGEVAGRLRGVVGVCSSSGSG